MRFFAHADLEHLSLLTPSVRRALLNAGADAELRIRSGWLWLDHVATEALVDRASTRIDWLFKAATAFEGVQAEVEQRVRKMTQDPVARVRERLLALLAKRAARRNSPTGSPVSLADDLDPAVRCCAAEVRRDADRLVAIARDAAISNDIRRRAGSALCEIGTPEQRVAVATILARPPHALPSVALSLVSSLTSEAEGVLIELVQTDSGTVAKARPVPAVRHRIRPLS